MLRLEEITASTLDYAYTYDNVRNILTKSTEHGTYSYVYDDVSRLTNAASPTQENEAYTYDGVGNRLASVVTSPIVHNANNELLAYGEMTYEYDANGNMVQKRIGTVAVNYVYNAENRLVKVEDDLTKTVIAEYDYEPFGRRLWKDVGGTRTYFLYADEGLVAEYNEQGTEMRSYGYQPDSTWTTNPLWLKQSGQYYWYQNDHLGTPQKLVDRNGTVVWEARYEAFGKAQVQVETVTNNLRFPGQYFDAETGLHYNWHRDYNPGIGRYVQMDPVGFAGEDVNLYGYVNNNPLVQADPTGEKIMIVPTFNYPISGNCCGKNEEIRNSVNRACREVFFNTFIPPIALPGQRPEVAISDSKLRKCILDRCTKNGEVKCIAKTCDRPQSCDDTAAYNPRYGIWKFVIYYSHKAVLCFPDISVQGYDIGKAVIHEWAHSCKWEHSNWEAGVPYTPGPDGRVQGP